MTLLADALAGKSLLIFDFDGTVADSGAAHANAFAQTLAPLGVVVDYSSVAGLRTRDAVLVALRNNSLQLSNSQVDELVQQKQSRVRGEIARGLVPLPGVDEFLRWARTRYRLAMATSGSRATVQVALAALGYEDWFDPLVCADDVVRAKPSPEIFLVALRMAQTTRESALIFEDSDAGFAAAEAAGIDYFDARGGLAQHSVGVVS